MVDHQVVGLCFAVVHHPFSSVDTTIQIRNTVCIDIFFLDRASIPFIYAKRLRNMKKEVAIQDGKHRNTLWRFSMIGSPVAAPSATSHSLFVSCSCEVVPMKYIDKADELRHLLVCLVIMPP